MTAPKLRRLLASALVLAALALSASASAGQDSMQRSMTIRLLSTNESARVTEKLPKGPSKGDVVYQTSVLRNAVAQLGRAKGARVGSDSATIKLSSPKAGVLSVLVKLPGGTIRARGVVLAADALHPVPVIGGSGRFEGARGTSEVRDLGNGRAMCSLAG